VDVGGVNLEMVWIPPGAFTMGSPTNELARDKDESEHRVTLTKGFWLGKYEVTKELWERVTGTNPSNFKNAGGRAPVESVSWDDCQEFIGMLNRMVSGGGFRLPTEAEWECACRAGTTSQFYSADSDFGGCAWYKRNSGEKTHSVGQKKANAWGLHDMSGNVWEWCQDWYGEYPAGAVSDPEGPGSGVVRVGRGGSWFIDAWGCRSAARNWYDRGIRSPLLGFRLARTP